MLKIILLFKKFTNFTSKNSVILRINNPKFSGYFFTGTQTFRGIFKSALVYLQNYQKLNTIFRKFVLRSSHRRFSSEKRCSLKKIANFTEKHLCWSLLIKFQAILRCLFLCFIFTHPAHFE